MNRRQFLTLPIVVAPALALGSTSYSTTAIVLVLPDGSEVGPCEALIDYAQRTDLSVVEVQLPRVPVTAGEGKLTPGAVCGIKHYDPALSGFWGIASATSYQLDLSTWTRSWKLRLFRPVNSKEAM